MSAPVPTRRQLLAAGAVAMLAGPAAATAATTTSGATPVSVTDRLQRLIRLELLLLYCYRHVVASSVLTAHARAVLTPFVAHEEAHIAALGARLRDRGGTLPAGPATDRAANHDLAHRGIGGRLGQLRGDADALRLLLTTEQVTIGAYSVALTLLTDRELIGLVCQIMANEAQHDALIALTLPKSTLDSAAPYGLVQGLQ